MTIHSTKVDGRPSFQFYPSDWGDDNALQLCSLAARGLWIEMINLMFNAPQRGHLLKANGKQMESKELALLVHANKEEVDQLLTELKSEGVYSTLEDGTIYSRRMYREWASRDKISEARSQAGKAGAEARWNSKPMAKPIAKPMAKMAASTSTSTSTSKSVCVKPCSTLPAFPLKLDGRTWTLTQDKLDELQETFPNKPVLAICRKAWQWCKDNPAKRKTEQGMPAFLSKWISNEYVEVLDEQPDMVSVNWLLEQIDTRAMEHDAAIKAIQNPKNLKRAIDRKTAMKLYCDAKGIEIEARG